MQENFSKLLLERFQRGESEAAEEIYARYAKRLMRLAKSRISTALQAKFDADDILQSSFQSFFEKATRGEVDWKKQGDLWRLLAAIVLNHVQRQVELFTAQKRRHEIEVPELSSRLQANDRSLEFSEFLESMLVGESPVIGQVASLRLAGFTHAEIATRIGRSERTVRRMLQMLKAKLAADSAIGLGDHFADEKISELGDQQLSNPKGLFQSEYHDFDLLRMIGAGAFGKVYLAKSQRDQSFVAIKTLRKNWLNNKTAEQLFFNEAQLLVNINHPNVAKFLGAGPLPNGSWFIVLQWVRGHSLAEHLGESQAPSWRDVHPPRPLELEQVIDWLVQAADALTAIHQLGVVHGDLKPENILIDHRGITKLIDFGFANWSQWGQRSNAVPVRRTGGTHGFLAPEPTLSSASDMFAYGEIINTIVGKMKLAPTVEDRLVQLANQLTQNQPEQRPSAQKTRSCLLGIQHATGDLC